MHSWQIFRLSSRHFQNLAEIGLVMPSKLLPKEHPELAGGKRGFPLRSVLPGWRDFRTWGSLVPGRCHPGTGVGKKRALEDWTPELSQLSPNGPAQLLSESGWERSGDKGQKGPAESGLG